MPLHSFFPKKIPAFSGWLSPASDLHHIITIHEGVITLNTGKGATAARPLAQPLNPVLLVFGPLWVSCYTCGTLAARHKRPFRGKPYFFDLPENADLQPASYDDTVKGLAACGTHGLEDIAQLALLQGGAAAAEAHLEPLAESPHTLMLKSHLVRLKFAAQKDKAIAVALAGDRPLGLAHIKEALTCFPALESETPDARKKRGKTAILGDLSLPQCRHYRAEQKLEQLRHIGIEARLYDLEQADVLSPTLGDFDFLIIYRLPLTPRLHDIIAAAKACGLPLVYEIDDLLFDADAFPSSHKDYDSIFAPEEYAELEILPPLYAAALNLCDHALASTLPLAEAMRRISVKQNVFVHANGMDNTHYAAVKAAQRASSHKVSGTNLFYGSGSRGHQSDFTAVACAALAPLMSRHKHISLTLAGYMDLPESLTPFTDRIQRLTFSDTQAYWAALSQADINLAPLSPSAFNDCKSAIKWLEAAMFGIPTIASNTAGFRHVIKDGVDGFLCDDWTAWQDKIAHCLADLESLSVLGANAARKATEHYSRRALCDNLSHIVAAIGPNGSTGGRRMSRRS